MFLSPAFKSNRVKLFIFIYIYKKKKRVNIIFLTSLIQEPFNAEPPRSLLVSSYVTPVDLFYKRNHGPIPIVDDLERFHLLF